MTDIKKKKSILIIFDRVLYLANLKKRSTNAGSSAPNSKDWKGRKGHFTRQFVLQYLRFQRFAFTTLYTLTLTCTPHGPMFVLP